MSLHLRIALSITIVLSLTFGSIAIVVWGLPQSLDLEIDRELLAIQEQILDGARARGNIELQDLDWPDEMNSLESGSTFFTVLNADGDVVKHSINLDEEDALLLDPILGTNDIQRDSLPLSGQSLRILSYPIVGQFAQGDELIGYLQVARLGNDYASFEILTRATQFAILGGLFLSLFLVLFVIPNSLVPLYEIVGATSRITSADDLGNVRITPRGGSDIVSQLVRSFNELLARLEELFRRQQRLLADVSHELRTPLTAIRGNVDLIRRMGEPDAESLDAIEIEAERMTRLVNDLLTLARADVGGLPIQQELVDLDMIFLHIYEQVTIIHQPVRVILRDLSPALVLGDRDRLAQLMLNLVTNAIKYTDPGGRVWASLTVTEDMAVYTVEDTGIGIPSEDLPRIFDRFYRVSKARARSEQRGGAGLGLSIVKSIVDAHNGDITVDSVFGEGSTFTVTIPLYKLPEVTSQNTA